MDPEKEVVLGGMVSVLHQCLLAVVYSGEHSGMDDSGRALKSVQVLAQVVLNSVKLKIK